MREHKQRGRASEAPPAGSLCSGFLVLGGTAGGDQSGGVHILGVGVVGGELERGDPGGGDAACAKVQVRLLKLCPGPAEALPALIDM